MASAFSLLPEAPQMGMTDIKAKVVNPADVSKSVKLKFLIDSGAVYSVVPRKVLEKVGIKPRTTKTFSLADGKDIERQMGIAQFEYAGEITAGPVIFGEKGDAILMGATTLEGFGLVLDPIRRELRPIPLRM